MGNKVIPYTFAVGEKLTYFISTPYKFIENDKTQEGMLLNSSNDSLDPYDYDLSKYGLDCFKKFSDCNRIHSSWLTKESAYMEESFEDKVDIVNVLEDVPEDVNIPKLEYNDGSNEVVKIFNQKCVICLERDSDYIFKQCGHQCFCEECYQNKGDNDILKCVFCRT